MRSSRLILGFLTIFVACGTLAWELKYRQAFITLVKPIPRWQFLVGKWVGVGLLNVILLACVGLVVEGFTWHFRGRPGLAAHVAENRPQRHRAPACRRHLRRLDRREHPDVPRRGAAAARPLR